MQPWHPLEKNLPALIWETIASCLLYSDGGIRASLNLGSTCKQVHSYIIGSAMLWKTIARMLGIGVGWFQAQLTFENGPIVHTLREFVLRSLKLWDKAFKLGAARYRTWYHVRMTQWERFTIKWFSKNDIDFSNFALKIKGPTSAQVSPSKLQNFLLMIQCRCWHPHCRSCFSSEEYTM